MRDAAIVCLEAQRQRAVAHELGFLGATLMRVRAFFVWLWLDSGRRRPITVGAAVLLAAVIGVAHFSAKADDKPTGTGPKATAPAPGSDPSVQLNDAQLKIIKISAASEHAFPQERTAVGSIDFNENLAVQVFSPYQGKIIKAYVEVGDPVKKGQTLFTIESPDLIQADSNLIAAAGLLDLTTHALDRAKQLYEIQGIAEKDLQQAISDQQTAEGALKAGRDAVRVFGKSEAEIDAIVANRRIDPVLVVPSPITGQVTARVAQPGLLVQPGNAPAPYTIADVVTVWMLANVSESNIKYINAGQKVDVSTMAYPGQVYEGEITVVGATVDPNLHTLLIRSEIQNPRRDLKPGMLATFVIRIGEPVVTPAVPPESVVREGDGTMTIWVTTDQHHFTQRKVKLGLQSGGYDQILDGLKQGELVVTDGAVFLDNMLIPSTDG
jgi:cobalt-zinc-cadmium efflux system membrane fusion protein